MATKAAKVGGGVLPYNISRLLVVCEILSEGTCCYKGIAACYTKEEEMVEKEEKEVERRWREKK